MTFSTRLTPQRRISERELLLMVQARELEMLKLMTSHPQRHRQRRLLKLSATARARRLTRHLRRQRLREMQEQALEEFQRSAELGTPAGGVRARAEATRGDDDCDSVAAIGVAVDIFLKEERREDEKLKTFL